MYCHVIDAHAAHCAGIIFGVSWPWTNPQIADDLYRPNYCNLSCTQLSFPIRFPWSEFYGWKNELKPPTSFCFALKLSPCSTKMVFKGSGEHLQGFRPDQTPTCLWKPAAFRAQWCHCWNTAGLGWQRVWLALLERSSSMSHVLSW